MAKRLTTEEWIKQCKEVHGDDLFDYSNSIYINNKTLIEIGCKVHGIIKVHPQRHKTGSKCRRCSSQTNSPFKKSSLEELKKSFVEIHGDKYNYDKILDFETQHDKVTITCKIHGDFQQRLYSHKHGSGCEKCSYIKRGLDQRLSLEEFKTRSSLIHKGKYQYSKVDFETLKDSVIITCPHHGDFTQKAQDHLQGGCKQCGKIASTYTYKGDEDCIEVSKTLNSGVYLMKVGNYYKIGVTKHIRQRMNLIRSRLSKGTSIELLAFKEMSLFNAIELENTLHIDYKNYSRIYPEYFEGQTECFNLSLPINGIIKTLTGN